MSNIYMILKSLIYSQLIWTILGLFEKINTICYNFYDISNQTFFINDSITKIYKNEILPFFLDLHFMLFLGVLSIYKKDISKEEKKKELKSFIKTLILNNIFTNILKSVFLHPRPFTLDLLGYNEKNINNGFIKIKDLFFTKNINKSINYLFSSFPSGHTSMSIVCLLFVLKNYKLKYISIISFLLICVTRIVGHRHHLKDIIFGSIIGSLSYLLIN
jgi:membrane-associated phospholipid phosphatase